MAIRVISLNCNGIRAAARKGMFQWLERQGADFVCLQETKAQEHQLEDEQFRPDGYHVFYEDAEKKGYSGVAVYSRHKPKRVVRGFGSAEFDAEGRYLEVEVDGLSVVSLYLPSGSSSEARQEAKFRFLDQFAEIGMAVAVGIDFGQTPAEIAQPFDGCLRAFETIKGEVQLLTVVRG